MDHPRLSSAAYGVAGARRGVGRKGIQVREPRTRESFAVPGQKEGFGALKWLRMIPVEEVYFTWNQRDEGKG